MWGCGRGEPSDASVVVRIGERSVDMEEFDRRARGLLRTSFRDVSREDTTARERLLEAIIARELLLGECLKRKYDGDPRISRLVARLEQRITIEKLYAQQAHGERQYTDEELLAYYREQRFDVEVRSHQILGASDSAAREALARLESGEAFSTLVPLYTNSSALRRFGPEGDVGWWKVGEMPQGPREVVADMEVGTVFPEPVKSYMGYHVVELVDRRPVPFDSVRTTVEAHLKRSTQASERTAYSDALRRRYEMIYYPEALEQLMGIPPGTREVEGGEEPVMSWDGGGLTVAGYMELHRAGQVKHPASQSREGLQTLIDDLAGQRVMMEEARRLGLDRDPDVLARTGRRRDHLMLEQLLRVESKQWPTVTDEQIRAYYDTHTEHFTLADDVVADFHTVKGGVRSLLEKRMENESMDSLIDSLRSATTIEVDDQVLASALR